MLSIDNTKEGPTEKRHSSFSLPSNAKDLLMQHYRPQHRISMLPHTRADIFDDSQLYIQPNLIEFNNNYIFSHSSILSSSSSSSILSRGISRKTTNNEVEDLFKQSSKILLLEDSGIDSNNLILNFAQAWAHGTLWKENFQYVIRIDAAYLLKQEWRQASLGKSISSQQLLKDLLINLTSKIGLKAYHIDQILENSSSFSLFILENFHIINSLDIDSKVEKVISQLGKQKYLLVTADYPSMNSADSYFKFDKILMDTGLNQKNINQYIEDYFNEEAKSLSEFFKQNQGMAKICSSPSMLEMICYILSSKHSHNLKSNIAATTLTTIYHDITSLFALKHTKNSAIDAFNLPLVKFMHELAYESLTSKAINDNTLAKVLQKYNAATDDMFMRSLLSFGLIKLNKSSDEIDQKYEFINKEIQAFFAAYHLKNMLLSENKKENDTALNLISLRYDENKYELTIKFLAGLLSMHEYDGEDMLEKKQIIMRKFWDAIILDNHDILRVKGNRYVEILMNLMSQSNADAPEEIKSYVDDIILKDIISWKQALIDSQYSSNKIINSLLEDMGKENKSEKLKAIKALTWMNVNGALAKEPIIHKLISMTSNNDLEIVEAAMRALEKMSIHNNEEIRDFFLSMLDDARKDVVMIAIEMLESFSNQNIFDKLMDKMTEEQNSWIVYASIAALSRHNHKPQSATRFVEQLIKKLSSYRENDQLFFDQFIKILKEYNINITSVIQKLITEVKDQDILVACQAIDSLKTIFAMADLPDNSNQEEVANILHDILKPKKTFTSIMKRANTEPVLHKKAIELITEVFFKTNSNTQQKLFSLFTRRVDGKNISEEMKLEYINAVGKIFDYDAPIATDVLLNKIRNSNSFAAKLASLKVLEANVNLISISKSDLVSLIESNKNSVNNEYLMAIISFASKAFYKTPGKYLVATKSPGATNVGEQDKKILDPILKLLDVNNDKEMILSGLKIVENLADKIQLGYKDAVLEAIKNGNLLNSVHDEIQIAAIDVRNTLDARRTIDKSLCFIDDLIAKLNQECSSKVKITILHALSRNAHIATIMEIDILKPAILNMLFDPGKVSEVSIELYIELYTGRDLLNYLMDKANELDVNKGLVISVFATTLEKVKYKIDNENIIKFVIDECKNPESYGLMIRLLYKLNQEYNFPENLKTEAELILQNYLQNSVLAYNQYSIEHQYDEIDVLANKYTDSDSSITIEDYAKIERLFEVILFKALDSRNPAIIDSRMNLLMRIKDKNNYIFDVLHQKLKSANNYEDKDELVAIIKEGFKENAAVTLELSEQYENQRSDLENSEFDLQSILDDLNEFRYLVQKRNLHVKVTYKHLIIGKTHFDINVDQANKIHTALTNGNDNKIDDHLFSDYTQTHLANYNAQLSLLKYSENYIVILEEKDFAHKVKLYKFMMNDGQVKVSQYSSRDDKYRELLLGPANEYAEYKIKSVTIDKLTSQSLINDLSNARNNQMLSRIAASVMPRNTITYNIKHNELIKYSGIEVRLENLENEQPQLRQALSELAISQKTINNIVETIQRSRNLEPPSDLSPYKEALYIHIVQMLMQIYLASMVVQTEMVENKQKGVLATVSTLMIYLGPLFPPIGIAVNVFGQILKLIDEDSQNFISANLAKIAATPEHMSFISHSIASEIVTSKEIRLERVPAILSAKIQSVFDAPEKKTRAAIKIIADHLTARNLEITESSEEVQGKVDAEIMVDILWSYMAAGHLKLQSDPNINTQELLGYLQKEQYIIPADKIELKLLRPQDIPIENIDEANNANALNDIAYNQQTDLHEVGFALMKAAESFPSVKYLGKNYLHIQSYLPKTNIGDFIAKHEYEIGVATYLLGTAIYIYAEPKAVIPALSSSFIFAAKPTIYAAENKIISQFCYEEDGWYKFMKYLITDASVAVAMNLPIMPVTPFTVGLVAAQGAFTGALRYFDQQPEQRSGYLGEVTAFISTSVTLGYLTKLVSKQDNIMDKILITTSGIASAATVHYTSKTAVNYIEGQVIELVGFNATQNEIEA